eukprot:8269962-Pyramimonas_sp.AAC.1
MPSPDAVDRGPLPHQSDGGARIEGDSNGGDDNYCDEAERGSGNVRPVQGSERAVRGEHVGGDGA